MELLAVFVAGFAVALAAYFLQGAVLSRTPGFDGGAVGRLGIALAALIFAFSGPVLVLRATLKVLAAEPGGRVGPVHIAALALVPLWAGMIGVLAIGAGRLVAAG